MTKEELKALIQSMTPEEYAEFEAQLSDDDAEKISKVLSEQSLGEKAFDYALRALDYAGGLTRTGAAGLGELVTGKDLVQEGDLLKALQGKAPQTSEFLERGGAGEWGSVDVPLLGRVTGRDLAGFTGDVLLDPLTYLTLGTGGAAKTALKETGKKVLAGKKIPENLAQKGLNTLLRPTQALRQKTGRSIYGASAPLKRGDVYAKRFGKDQDALSNTLFKHGITGSAESTQKQAALLANSLMDRRNQILKIADDAGVIADAGKALAPVIKDLRQTAQSKKVLNPSVKTQAQKFAEILEDYVQQNKYVPERLPNPEQVPLMFSSELPKGGMRVTEGTQAVAENILPRAVPARGPQMDLFPSGGELIPNTNIYATKLGTPSGQMPYTIIQGQSAIDKGQQLLLRPQDLIQPVAPIPATGGLKPSEMSDLTTQLYKMSQDSAYDTLRSSTPGQKASKRAAARTDTARAAAIRKVDPKLAREFREINKDLSALLTTKKPMATEASKEVMKNAITPIDTSLFYLDPLLGAAKKAGDISKTPGFRTKVGMSMATDPGTYDVLLRRALIERSYDDNER